MNEGRPAPRDSGVYDAFISYSHAVDNKLAPALQRGLQRFAKTWYRVRALRIFRDETGLSANPHLWSSIVQALDSSEHFVLLASPDAAQSPWVAREVEHWCTAKSSERMLIALTEGEVHWDPAAGDFDWQRTTALPDVLRGRFAEEPRWIDLRWARTETDLSLSHPAFRDAVAEIAAPLHGRPKEELASEEVRQHRRTVRIARSAAALLVVLTAASIAAGLLALDARDQARQQLAVAQSSALAGQANADYTSQLDRGLLLALEAYRISPTAQARASLVQGLEDSAGVVRFLHLPGAVDSIAFSPSGRTLAVGVHALPYRVERFSVASGRQVGRPLLDHYGPDSLAFSPDGKDLAADDCSGVALRFDLATAKPVGHALLLRLPSCAVQGLAFAAGGRQLIASDSFGNVFRWDIASGRPLSTVNGRNYSDPNAEGAAISPDRREIATGGRQLTVWRPGGGVVGSPLNSYAGGGPLITSAAFAPRGGDVAAGTFVGTVLRWNPTAGRFAGPPLGGFVDPAAVTSSVAFSPDGRLVAAGDSSGTVTIFDVARSLLGSRTAPALTIPVSSQSCFSRSRNRTVSVVGCDRCGVPTECLYAYAPGRHMVAVGDITGNVKLYDVRTRQAVARLAVARTASGYSSIDALSFSPDGRTLAAMSASVGASRSEALWNAFGNNPVTDTLGTLYSKSLVRAGSQSVTLWDVSSGTQLGSPLDAAAGLGRAVRFGADGHSLTAYASRYRSGTRWPGGTVTWRPLPLGGGIDAIRARICSVAGRNLTLTEWREFVPGRAYRKLCPQWP